VRGALGMENEKLQPAWIGSVSRIPGTVSAGRAPE